jgi:hypothetical protein
MMKIIYIILLLFSCFGFADIEKQPRSGVGIRLSSFGIPNKLLDLLVYEHPRVNGSSYAFEIRSFSIEGQHSIFSGLFAMEYSSMSGQGTWRLEQSDNRLTGSGEIKQIGLSATILMHMFPSLPVHPYFGGGIGICRASIWAEGVYSDSLGTEIKDSYKENLYLPVIHIPIGIKINIYEKVEVRFEGGFKNGFYFGAAAAYCF